MASLGSIVNGLFQATMLKLKLIGSLYVKTSEEDYTSKKKKKSNNKKESNDEKAQ